MSLIQISNMSKYFGDREIFRDFSLNIERGEILAITGKSGCGKSTLLNIIGLIEDFDEGILTIDNISNIRVNSSLSNKLLREKISYLFQNFALVDEETVRYNLELALKYNSKGKKDKKEKIENALKFVGLEGYEENYIYELSGGEQQRIAIGRAMLKPSEIILADEPTGSLDEENRELVINLLKEINKTGKTIIIVTHDSYVAGECTREIKL
ncbi:MAG: ABC transporter ATP-binding protein [Clostridium sp.]|uniref:ABC transporter ATP-binding protein n=1 Tax=Clostridium TaxID=1485 RepID=UPI0018840C7A|nr:ABC transporter ATP-binding protein [Clostridium chrysemydis]